MKDKFLKQTEREYSPGRRLALLVVAGSFFLILLPILLVLFSAWLDGRLSLPSFAWTPWTTLLGWALIISGFLFAMWAVVVQFTLGRGTPVPVMATQELIVRPPYNYCRNPMALGTIVMYLGVAVAIGSVSAIVLTLLGAALLLSYIKIAEEEEMTLRFGDSYQAYRQQTPFIIPHFGRRYDQDKNGAGVS